MTGTKGAESGFVGDAEAEEDAVDREWDGLGMSTFVFVFVFVIVLVFVFQFLI